MVYVSSTPQALIIRASETYVMDYGQSRCLACVIASECESELRWIEVVYRVGRGCVHVQWSPVVVKHASGANE